LTKVLYILGYARSGTTILASLLGEIDGFFHAGELWYFWDRCFPPRSTARCGCWAVLPECSLWSAILDTLASSEASDSLKVCHRTAGPGGVSHPELSTMIELQRQADRSVRYWHPLKGVVPRIRHSEAVELFCRVQGALYRTVSAQTRAKVIVDSSKLPTPAVLLTAMPGIEPYFVHMVRDPRGVLFSRQRYRMEQAGRGNFNRSLLAVEAVRCARDNLYSEAIVRRFGDGRQLFVSYEQFVAEPRETIGAIGELVGMPVDSLPLAGHIASLKTNHTVRANRNRFRTGQVEIRPDTEWQRALGARDRFLGSLLAAPLLLRYGYPLRALRSR
jgi:sulfotransferase family protein